MSSATSLTTTERDTHSNDSAVQDHDAPNDNDGPGQKSNDKDYKPYTHSDSYVQVLFDPHIKSARRRKVSLPDSLAETNQAGTAFLHKILGDHTFDMGQGEGGENIEGCGYLHTMTRTQLHDMVLGLREMGRQYANLQLQIDVREVFILTKPWDKSLVVQTKQLAWWLLEHGYNVYIESTFEQELDTCILDDLEVKEKLTGKLSYWTPKMCTEKPSVFDFVITLGGDGTVLYASWLFQKVVPPVLSFSLGSLGFLTKFDFARHPEILTRMFGKGGVTVGLRLRFEGTIMRSIQMHGKGGNQERSLCDELSDREESNKNTHQPDGTVVILNEIVVDRGPNPTMSTTELYVNDEFLTSVAADGVCIATPTGSTAYSLAAGGSLCHPALPGMLVSIICAHSLTFRPIIVPDSTVLRIGVPYDARSTAWVSFDGKQRQELNQGDYVTIVASQYPLPTVQSRMDNKDWFDSIKRTMNWGDRKTQKTN